MSYTTQFRIVRALLILGVLAGYGHGFSSLARHHHGRGHGHCHAGQVAPPAERPAPPSR